MRVLMLSPVYPTPTDNGTKRRISAFLKHLTGRFDVTLLAFSEQPQDVTRSRGHSDLPMRRHVIKLSQDKSRTVARSLLSQRTYREVKFFDRRYQRALRELLRREHYDFIWVNFLNMATYLESEFRFVRGTSILLLDQHNVDEEYWRSFLNPRVPLPNRLMAGWELVKARRLQTRLFPKFDALISVSVEDVESTAKYVDEKKKLWLAPNGVDIGFFMPNPSERGIGDRLVLIFGGSMDAHMNQDAALWFAHEILPRVAEEIPTTTFWIIGRNPPRKIQGLESDRRIKVSGTVPDVRDYYSQADLFVIPLRMGGGTKLKTLEAMAMAIPIVSTNEGVRGLEASPGVHYELGDTAATMASMVIQLARDPQRGKRMGRNARKLVEEKYSWASIVGDVEEKMLELVKN